jgi:YHS domain-containing protein/uncharacterized membrane protein
VNPNPSDFALFFGRLHPVLVHLPIGLLVLLALLELFARSRRFRNANANAGFMLALSFPLACFTVLCGWLLSNAGGYDPRLLQLHKWTGIVTAAGCGLAALFYSLDKKRLYHASLFATFGLLVVASHFGGSLTHGSDYLVQYAPRPLRNLFLAGKKPPAQPSKPIELAQVRVYPDVIQPLLKQYCVSCHGPEKAKGGLHLDSLQAILKGGENGPVIDSANPGQSIVIKRVHLPVEHDDHMPPDGKPQPSAENIALLEWWIKTGASGDKTVAELKPPPQVQKVLAARFGAPAAPAVASSARPKPLKDLTETTTRLSDELGIAISALSPSEPWLQCNASVAGTNFGDTQLARLAPLAGNIRWLDLGGSAVTDAGLTHVSAMPGLQRLHLERTGISDAGLAAIASLPELEYLNLYGTPITDAGIAALQALPRLKQVYVWQTKVTPAAVKALAEARTDKDQISRWEQEIEQLKRKIRDQQLFVEMGIVAAKPSNEQSPVNQKCPISGKPVDASKTVVHEGKLIAFCCDDCRAKFQQDPKTFLAKLDPSETPSKLINDKCPVSGKPVDASKTAVYEGKLVAFCCDDCKAKFQQDPKPFVSKLALNTPKPDSTSK